MKQCWQNTFMHEQKLFKTSWQPNTCNFSPRSLFGSETNLLLIPWCFLVINAVRWLNCYWWLNVLRGYYLQTSQCSFCLIFPHLCYLEPLWIQIFFKQLKLWMSFEQLQLITHYCYCLCGLLFFLGDLYILLLSS